MKCFAVKGFIEMMFSILSIRKILNSIYKNYAFYVSIVEIKTSIK